MTDPGIWTLMITAMLLAAGHALSPDHWFPFVAIGRANSWSPARVSALAALAATGHVTSSVAVALITVFAEKGAPKEAAEILHDITPTLLILFGLGYALISAYKLRKSHHGHSHGLSFLNRKLGIDPHDYEMRDDEHAHDHAHHHTHDVPCAPDHHHTESHCDCPSLPGRHMSTRAAWGLVLILGLTPCIALVPLTFAARVHGTSATVAVILVFALSAVLSILVATRLALHGLRLVRLGFFDRYSSIAAGILIALIGIAGHIFEHSHH